MKFELAGRHEFHQLLIMRWLYLAFQERQGLYRQPRVCFSVEASGLANSAHARLARVTGKTDSPSSSQLEAEAKLLHSNQLSKIIGP